jgi:hypothetical protein
MANLAKMAKMANIAEAGRDSIFTIFPGAGGKHAEPDEAVCDPSS